MDWKRLYCLLEQRLDVRQCLETAAAIWENDRWCTTEKNRRTADFCAELFRAAGLSQVEQLPLQADGKTKYLDWKLPRAWDAHGATLCYADGEVIADYAKMPCSLVMYSPATPPEGVCAQVVIPHREKPEACRGKVLLVGEAAADWVDFAQENGAVGILSDFIRIHPGVRDSREALYGEVMWMGMQAQSVFGFHLTPCQGDEMRRRLECGTVWVKARVDSRRYDGVCYTVSAALEGTDPAAPEVLLYGHLYEPGANDNAAGAAAILQLARLFAGAVAEGTLPRPRRTLRFAMGYECSGSMGYMAAHRDRPLLCAMAVDMVGAEAGENAVAAFRYDPMANFSYADGALFALQKIAMECSGAFDLNNAPFDILTDNILADPSLGCPAVAMCAAPALSYHSSMDRPDRLEPETLKRNALIAGTWAWGMATAEEESCAFLADAIDGLTRLLARQSTHPRQAQLFRDAKQAALHSLGRLTGKVTSPPEFFTEAAPDYARQAVGRIPQRRVPGILTWRDDRFCAAWSRDWNIPLFWVDGRRDLWQIAYLSAVEKGRCTDDCLREELAQLTDYFDRLTQNGYLEWK